MAKKLIKPHTRIVNGKRVMISAHVKNVQQTYGHLTQSDIEFLQYINQFAYKPIIFTDKEMNTRWLSERIEEQRAKPIWKHLSSNRDSQKHFRIDPMDATEGIFFVDTHYLSSIAGNKTGMLDKEAPLREAFNKNIKLPTPQIWLRDGDLGEGNHRVFVAKERGLKSVPVRVYWK